MLERRPARPLPALSMVGCGEAAAAAQRRCWR